MRLLTTFAGGGTPFYARVSLPNAALVRARESDQQSKPSQGPFVPAAGVGIFADALEHFLIR